MATVAERRNRRKRAVGRKTDRAAAPDERLRRLLECTRAVPWEADATTWRFTYVGPQAAWLLGYPPEAWYTEGFWTEHLHPDDRESAIKLCLERSKSSTDFDFQYRMLARDGHSVWIHDVVNVESVDGVPKTLLGFMIDITAQKDQGYDCHSPRGFSRQRGWATSPPFGRSHSGFRLTPPRICLREHPYTFRPGTL